MGSNAGIALSSGSIEALDISGAEQITFGQHAGESFAEVLESDPGYCAWAVAQPDPSPALAQFATFVRRAQNMPTGNSTSAASGASPSGSETSGHGRPDMDAVRAARLARLGGAG